MNTNRRFGVTIGVMYMALIATTTLSTGQELRPSEHGLEYQNESPAGKKSPDMASFFLGSSSATSSVEQPRAVNTTDPAWWSWGRGGGRRSEEGKKDHVKKIVLLVVSLVCGITGVALLVTVVFVFLFRFQRKRSSPPSLPSPLSSPSPLLRDK